MDEAVRAYVDAIPLEYRALFDRLHGLVLEVRPDAELVLSYQMPTYRAGRRRLFIGAWKHGLSLYGWDQGSDGGFIERHGDLKSGRATIRIGPDAAAAIADDEFLDLFRAALEA